MGKNTDQESSLSRAVSDMREALGSIRFWLLDAGGGAVIGAVTGPLWGVAWVFSIGAVTFLHLLYRAPYRQRDDARGKVRDLEDLLPLAERLGELATEIADFTRDFEATRPSPRDSLNYFPNSIGNNEITGVHSNMVITEDSNAFEVRMIMNAQDEKRNHEIYYLDKFHSEFDGPILSRLQKASDIGAITPDEFEKLESSMRQNFLGNSSVLFRMASQLCSKAAQSIRELEK